MKAQPNQHDYIKTALRLPPSLHEELANAAKQNGRSMNAEILARLSFTPLADSMSELSRQQLEVKALCKDILEGISHLR